MTWQVTLVLKITRVYHSVRALVPDPRPLVLPPQGIERNELIEAEVAALQRHCVIEEEELRLNK